MKNKHKSEKIISLTALVIAIIAITFGFAGYTRSIVISNRRTEPNQNAFRVGFSTDYTSISEGTIKPTVAKYSKLINASDATLTETNVSGINIEFLNSDALVTYDFFVYNDGRYDAYLNDIIFNNVNGYDTNIVCVPIEASASEAVERACKEISIGIINYGYSTDIQYNTVNNIHGYRLGKGKFHSITVVINYKGSGIELEGPFTVKFGSITLNYSILD